MRETSGASNTCVNLLQEFPHEIRSHERRHSSCPRVERGRQIGRTTALADGVRGTQETGTPIHGAGASGLYLTIRRIGERTIRTPAEHESPMGESRPVSWRVRSHDAADSC